MKYFELRFKIDPSDEAAGDVLAALLADAGCESFVPADEGMTAYVQQSLFDASAVDAAVQTLSTLLPDCHATYSVHDAADENWNATWEAEHHFLPIVLPDGQQIQIRPRQAFGSGEHATTQMMLRMLGNARATLAGKSIIDAGCGTGVLGIAAMKLGAEKVFAYDIDEWSVRNAQENFAMNEVEGEIAEGDSSVLNHAPWCDLLLANINRNILLADMPAFVSKLHPGGRLLLSGFLQEDIAPLTERAASLGLRLKDRLAEGEWRALEFRK